MNFMGSARRILDGQSIALSICFKWFNMHFGKNTHKIDQRLRGANMTHSQSPHLCGSLHLRNSSGGKNRPVFAPEAAEGDRSAPIHGEAAPQ